MGKLCVIHRKQICCKPCARHAIGGSKKGYNDRNIQVDKVR